jgi:hypothetical protein
MVLGTTIAQNADSKWAIGLGPGVHYNLNKGEIGGFDHEFYISRYLGPSFDLRLNSTGGYESGGIDYQSAYLNLRYKLYNGYIFSETAAVQPYLYGGGGMMWNNQGDGFAWNAGLGFKFPVSTNTSLFIEGGYTNGVEGTRAASVPDYRQVTTTDDLFKLTGIVEFAFGKAKDEDGDGVPDKKDKCPGTPPGVAVDENGCPLDRDGDGVPDYKDDCPDQPGDLMAVRIQTVTVFLTRMTIVQQLQDLQNSKDVLILMKMVYQIQKINVRIHQKVVRLMLMVAR